MVESRGQDKMMAGREVVLFTGMKRCRLVSCDVASARRLGKIGTPAKKYLPVAGS